MPTTDLPAKFVYVARDPRDGSRLIYELLTSTGGVYRLARPSMAGWFNALDEGLHPDATYQAWHDATVSLVGPAPEVRPLPAVAEHLDGDRTALRDWWRRVALAWRAVGGAPESIALAESEAAA